MSVPLWDDYLGAHPEHADVTPVVDAFGDSPEMAEALLELVLAGRKRATAGPVDPDEPVTVGDHWVVLDGSGAARAVLRTTEVRTGRLDSVDDAFARAEGEGDLTRDWWLDEHRAFVRRVLDLADDATVDDVAMTFERFAVVWPPRHAD